MISLLDKIKENYQWFKEQVAYLCVKAEFLKDMTGEQRKAWVISEADKLIKLNAFFDDVLNVDGLLLGVLIDKIVTVFNAVQFSDKIDVTPEVVYKIASVADAPLQAMVSVSSNELSIDQKLDLLFAQYGIEKAKPVETGVPKPPLPPVAYPTPSVPQVVPTQIGSENWRIAERMIFKAEGGYVNHPADKGGETNLGITTGTLVTAKAQGLVPASATIKTLTREQASTIYYNMYWKKNNCHNVQWYVAYLLYDAAVNGGLGMAARVFQEALNSTFDDKLAVDGKWGPKTNAALMKHFAIDTPVEPSYMNRFGTNYTVARKGYYDRIIANNSSQLVFKNGWYNRIKNLAKEFNYALPTSLKG
jgi:lysozyme family protein